MLLLSLLVDGLDWEISSQKMLEITEYTVRVDLFMSGMLKSPMNRPYPEASGRKSKCRKFNILLEQSACYSNESLIFKLTI